MVTIPIDDDEYSVLLVLFVSSNNDFHKRLEKQLCDVIVSIVNKFITKCDVIWVDA